MEPEFYRIQKLPPYVFVVSTDIAPNSSGRIARGGLREPSSGSGPPNRCPKKGAAYLGKKSLDSPSGSGYY